MSATTTPPPPFDIRADLAVLNALHARNKNQHHSSKWYKWFLILRRNLKKLVAGDQVEQRKKFVRRMVIPKCYVLVGSAFSTVIANKRFVSLGLVLMGILAGVHMYVGEGEEVVVKEKTEVVEKVEEVVRERWAVDQYAVNLEDFGEAVVRGSVDAGTGVGIGANAEGARGEVGASLRGEAISSIEGRKTSVLSEAIPAVTLEVENTPPHPQPDPEKSPLSPPPPPPRPTPPDRKPKKSKRGESEPGKRRKNRKKQDEIDDLFAGL